MKKEITVTLTDPKTGKPCEVTTTLHIRIYHGRIYDKDVDTINEHLNTLNEAFNWLTVYDFVQNGQWISNGKPIGSYQLCGLNGEVIEEYAGFQFSRSRDNMFYLETID